MEGEDNDLPTDTCTDGTRGEGTYLRTQASDCNKWLEIQSGP